ncbi:MAG: AbrB/MazE/SpoVT family DNA-binding domain-containing protein, partial [Desulfobacterales bacterium]|nr:AbrB/MazE/SpoVT family DNA-binding domain-containing protein [Desulfobacterales bacterium]
NGGEDTMKTARVFKSGNSQAVRLPKEFKLDVAEVHVFRKDGDLVLRPLKKTWQEYFVRGRRFSVVFPKSIEDLALEEQTSW